MATAITDAKKPAPGLMSTASETSLLLLYSTALSTLYPPPPFSATKCLLYESLSFCLDFGEGLILLCVFWAFLTVYSAGKVK